MASKKVSSTKQFFSNFLLILSGLALISCSLTPQKTLSVGAGNESELINKYRKMRLKSWKSYTKGIQVKRNQKQKIKKAIKRKRSPISMQHLKNNPIFNQVTQIHCFKIRASQSRCNAIKYLAMVNCGEIKSELEIKKYLRCLRLHFKK